MVRLHVVGKLDKVIERESKAGRKYFEGALISDNIIIKLVWFSSGIKSGDYVYAEGKADIIKDEIKCVCSYIETLKKTDETNEETTEKIPF